MDLVSVVMLCWNRRDDVRESLERLKMQTYKNIEVIIVDNCSSDGTVEMIENEYLPQNTRLDGIRFVLYKMPDNSGIGAYNIGFKNARGKYIVIIDDDSFPAYNALELMVQKFKRDSRLGIVAFDVRSYSGYDEVNVKIEAGQADSNADTSSAAKDYYMSFNGAGAGARKSVIEKAGFYPGEFFLYWNEMDLAFRVLDLGYKIEFFSDIVSYHKQSPTNRESERAPYYYTRNAFWVIWKNYPADMMIKLTYKLMRLVFYYSQEQATLVYIKALFAALVGIGQITGKRKPVKRSIAKKMRVAYETAFTFYR